MTGSEIYERPAEFRAAALTDDQLLEALHGRSDVDDAAMLRELRVREARRVAAEAAVARGLLSFEPGRAPPLEEAPQRAVQEHVVRPEMSPSVEPKIEPTRASLDNSLPPVGRDSAVQAEVPRQVVAVRVAQATALPRNDTSRPIIEAQPVSPRMLELMAAEASEEIPVPRAQVSSGRNFVASDVDHSGSKSVEISDHAPADVRMRGRISSLPPSFQVQSDSGTGVVGGMDIVASDKLLRALDDYLRRNGGRFPPHFEDYLSIPVRRSIELLVGTSLAGRLQHRPQTSGEWYTGFVA
jgi:hypothetical protein